jgi:hypothetical protein
MVSLEGNMAEQDKWPPAGANLEAVLGQYERPLKALSEAQIPAIILRRAYDPAHCRGLVQRFIANGLMRDPALPAPEGAHTRIDIGTSLGMRGNDKEDFLAHAAQTQQLFGTLFDGYDDPVKTMYTALSHLAPGQIVKTAYEPDGRPYGPAIFRVHYTHHAYQPHIDHVVLREKRFDYAVSRFEHQFAGVLCVQNAVHEGRAAQAILHRCLWTPQIQTHIAENNFHEYAAAQDVTHCRVELEPGDLYFFNTRCIHEVPAVEGSNPRIVLAVFIGYNDDDDEIFVWS